MDILDLFSIWYLYRYRRPTAGRARWHHSRAGSRVGKELVGCIVVLESLSQVGSWVGKGLNLHGPASSSCRAHPTDGDGTIEGES